MTTEAMILINGVELTYAQSMTIRVALENFASGLHADGLGDDPHGKEITQLYLERIGEIRVPLYSKSE